MPRKPVNHTTNQGLRGQFSVLSSRFLVGNLVLILIWALVALGPARVVAGGVVGDGTPESCTEAALDERLAGGGAVTFNCGSEPHTLMITSPKIIAANTNIDGSDLVTISGGGATNVFSVTLGISLELANLTIGDGQANVGGGIFNRGHLSIAHSVLASNFAPSGTGGAIYNTGVLTITNTIFSLNFAGSAGAIHNQGQLSITDSDISDNTANNSGGGILNAGIMTLAGSLVLNNTTSSGTGGGILNTNTLTVTDSTFFGNSAPSGGGLDNSGRLVIARSTLNLNTAGTGGGGGLHNIGTLVVANSTLSNNVAQQGGAISSNNSLTIASSTIVGNSASTEGGGIRSVGTASIENTIIADNTTTNCTGTFISRGHNLESETSCGFTATGDQRETDPQLGPLRDNGGLTPTHALRPTSPAIDAGPATCPATDQRGISRPRGQGCDIGAYELGVYVYLPVLLR